MLDHVDALYADVLRPRDLAVTRVFRAASLEAQRLYVRLCSRAGPLFRSDKLRYREIPDLPGAAAELARAGLLAVDTLDTPGAVGYAVELLRKAEVEEILARARLAPTGSQVRVTELRARCLAGVDTERLRAEILRRFHVYEPLGLAEISVYRLLFFGSPWQDLTSFVLADLGVVRYAPYRIDPQDRLFTTRAELEAALTLLDALERVGAAADAGDRDGLREAAAVATGLGGSEATEQLRDAALVRAGRAMERLGDPVEALAIYTATDAPPSRERRARILARRGETAAALEVCRGMTSSPRDEGEIQFAESFARRLNREPRRPDDHGPPVVLTLARGVAVSVEQAVLDHYRDQGWTGYRSENTYWNGIFGLLFWDILFEPHRGAFLHPFQRGPRDLNTPRFRVRRAVSIERRLEWIRASADWIAEALEVYDRYRGVECAPVAWQHLEREALIRIARRVPAVQVARILDRIITNPGVHGSGLPDLVLFPPDTGYLLAEVKGPGDHVQPNQKRWLEFFHRHAIPSGVIRVAWVVSAS